MKEVGRYVSANVKRNLQKRSQNRCECCSTDIVGDKHHIHEFSKGGLNTLENLIVLCPNCHRQLPKILTIEQQRQLQLWHKDTLNQHATHHFYSELSEFRLGNNLYKDTLSFIMINAQKIIYLYSENNRFYVNIIMLENFKPKLLVLSNRVIVAEKNSEIITNTQSLIVNVNGLEVLNIHKSVDGIVEIFLTFFFKDLECRIDEKQTVLFNNQVLMNNCTFTRSSIQWTA